MKITKEDFEKHRDQVDHWDAFSGILIRCKEEEYETKKNQILQNQEDAEKYHKIPSETIGFIKAFSWLNENQIEKIPDHPDNDRNREIVEQLKKRIEELTLPDNEIYSESNHDYHVWKELKKILGEEK